jgi:hypothetical protein
VQERKSHATLLGLRVMAPPPCAHAGTPAGPGGTGRSAEDRARDGGENGGRRGGGRERDV